MAGPFMLRLRVALFAILAVALVATGWAHRAPDVNDKVLAFLVANGATADDFCGGAGVPGSHGDPLCQACHISGGADLPPPETGPVRTDQAAEVAVTAPRENLTVVRVLDLARSPQGPPVA